MDFDRAELQVRQYGRHLSTNGGPVFVILLFTPTDPAGRFYFFEQNILDEGVLYFGQ